MSALVAETGQIGDVISAPSGARFDYTSLTIEDCTAVRTAADCIRRNMRAAIVDVGRDLARVKDLLPHGQFGTWLKAEFGMTDRAAQLYMSAARLADEYEPVSYLRAKTIYTLAAPSTPEKARAEVLDRLRAGEPVNDDAVISTISTARYEQREAERRTKDAARRSRRRSRANKAAAEEAWRIREKRDELEIVAARKVVDLIYTGLGGPQIDALRRAIKTAQAYRIYDELSRRLLGTEEVRDGALAQPVPSQEYIPLGKSALQK